MRLVINPSAKRAWITDYPETFSGYGAADVYDVDYRRKPARQGLSDGLSAT